MARVEMQQREDRVQQQDNALIEQFWMRCGEAQSGGKYAGLLPAGFAGHGHRLPSKHRLAAGAGVGSAGLSRRAGGGRLQGHQLGAFAERHAPPVSVPVSRKTARRRSHRAAGLSQTAAAFAEGSERGAGRCAVAGALRRSTAGAARQGDARSVVRHRAAGFRTGGAEHQRRQPARGAWCG